MGIRHLFRENNIVQHNFASMYDAYHHDNEALHVYITISNDFVLILAASPPET